MASVHKRKLDPRDKKTKPYYVRYLDPTRSKPDGTPTQGSRSFRTSKEADAYKRKVENELEAGTHVAAPLTVREVCERFSAWNEGRRDDGLIGYSRWRFVRDSIKNKILPGLGARLVVDLTAPMIHDWYRAMVKVGKVAPVTAKTHVTTLGMVLEFARRRGWLKVTSPTVDVIKDLRGLPKPKVRTFSPEDMRRLIEALQVRRFGARLRPYAMLRSIVLLGSVCGLRYGEIFGLKLGAIDFKRNLIAVRLSVTDRQLVKGPKSEAGIREVPMPSLVAGELSAWREAECLSDPDAFLFRTPGGRAMANRSFHVHLWRPLLKDAGLADGGKRFRFHSSRHFSASWMVDNGWPITEVAKVLGHATFDMTLSTYAHPLQTDERRVENAERIAQLLRPTPLLLSHTIPKRKRRQKEAEKAI